MGVLEGVLEALVYQELSSGVSPGKRRPSNGWAPSLDSCAERFAFNMV